MSKSKRFGFTLIELLVVIAIIALLMSILMPALSKVRKIAKKMVCQSNVRQWGIIMTLYTNDNDSKFMSGSIRDPLYSSYTRGAWIVTLNECYRDFQNKKQKVRLCPEATRTEAEGASILTPECAWDWRGLKGLGSEEGEFGSYGMNLWLFNVPNPANASNGWVGNLWGDSPIDHWKRKDIKGAAEIPMFLDSWWPGGRPKDDDNPTGAKNGPPTDQSSILANSWHTNGMAHFAVNRHSGSVNCVFVDNSVRDVGLKELWGLKWHKNYKVKNSYTQKGGNIDWPDFMKDSREFYNW